MSGRFVYGVQEFVYVWMVGGDSLYALGFVTVGEWGT